MRLSTSAAPQPPFSTPPNLRGIFLVSFAFVGLAILLSLIGMPLLALPAALAGVISARYLFFVSVVPLNMALTFVRSVHA